MSSGTRRIDPGFVRLLHSMSVAAEGRMSRAIAKEGGALRAAIRTTRPGVAKEGGAILAAIRTARLAIVADKTCIGEELDSFILPNDHCEGFGSFWR